MRYLHSAVVLGVICPAAMPAHAEEAPPEPIVVTGQGLEQLPSEPAYGIQVIERQRLQSTGSGRIEDALADAAGFQQFRRSDSRSSNPSAQGVTLRGLGGNATSRSLVLLDGVPMADPFFGYIPLSAIDPGQIATARVIRGGGSGAFGAGAVAGTVELQSAGPGDLGLVDARFVGDDRSETELAGSFAPALGQGYAVVSGRWDRGKGFWTTPASQRVGASARARYESWSAGVRAVAPLTGDIELQARGLVFNDQRTLRFKGANSRSEGQDASVRLVGRGPWQFDLLGYVQARDFGNIVISSTSFRKTLDQRNTPSTGLGGKVELRPPVGKDHVLRIGADWRVSDGRLFEDAYSGVTGLVTARRSAGGRNSDLGFYLEHDWTIGSLILTGGARLDRWTIRDGFFRETNPAGVVTIDNRFAERAGWDGSLRGGGVLAISSAVSLRASAYSGIRQPTLNELYRPFVVFPVTTRANAALANENLRGFEAGIDFTPSPDIRLALTAFDNRVDNAIANVTIGTNLRQRQNVDAVRSRGFEVSAGATWGQVSFHGALSLIDPVVEGSGASAALDGKRPAQTPRTAGSAGIAWRPGQGWLLSANLRYTGMQFEDDLETDRLPAATVIDAYAEAPIGPVTVFLRGENLGDAEIITRNQGGSIDLGVPRTIWAGVKVRIGR